MPQVSLSHCKKCGVELVPENSVPSGIRGNRLNSCRKCYNEYKRTTTKYNPEWHRNYGLKRRYGLTVDQYNFKLQIQFLGCAICKQEFNDDRKTNVDHNHVTNEVRDILCSRCNTIVGMVEQDENLVFAAVEYLKRHSLKKVS